EGRTFEPANQKPDEPHRDHHRPRRDHGDGDSIDELLLGQPVMFFDDTAVQEWHDGQPAAEHERSRLSEIPEHLPERLPVRDWNAADRSHERKGETGHYRASPRQSRRRADNPDEQPAAKEQPDDLG